MMLCLHHLLHEDPAEFHGEPLPSRGVPELREKQRGLGIWGVRSIPSPIGRPHARRSAPLPGPPRESGLPPTRVRDRAGSTCVCRCAEWGRGRGRAGRGHKGAWFVDVTGPAGQ